MSEPPHLYILLGPTASGKERTALAAAERMNGEIISVDSMKIYRTLDIGTAKATPQMRARIPHHCLDLIDPTESFSVADYIRAAEAAIEDIHRRGKTVILSGGTALYYKGLLEGLFDSPPADLDLRSKLKERAAAQGPDILHAELAEHDPAAAAKIHPNDLRRVIRALEVITLTGQPLSAQQLEWDGFHDDTPNSNTPRYRHPCTIVALDWPRPVLHTRIALRIDHMVRKGLEAEAHNAYNHRRSFDRTPLQAVGYKEWFPYFEGAATRDEALERLLINTRRLAKSQMTWFRKFPCQWLAMQEGEAPEHTAERVIDCWMKEEHL